MRAIKYGNFVEIDTFFMQLKHSLSNKRRLLRVRRERHHGGAQRMGAARSDKRLPELRLVRLNSRISNLEDLGNAPVIRLDLENLRFPMLLGKFQDVLEVCATPRVNALGVVTHDHDVAVAAGNQFDKFVLEVIGVLIFIHKDMLKLFLVERSDIIRCAEKFQGLRKKIVEIHGVCLFLADFIDALRTGDLLGKG